MKKKIHSKVVLIWIAAVLLYICFYLWHNGLGNPLSDREIEMYLQRISTANPNIDTERIETFRAFLGADDGKPVIMVNAILYNVKPLAVAGVSLNETSSEVLNRYNRFVMPYLLRRGGYPAMAGTVAANSLESWGIEDAEKWSIGALMRYRSRRDMMEMFTNPEFTKAHKYKFAAIEKTLVFPVTPYFFAGGLDIVVFLFLFSLAALIHLVICIFRIRKISQENT